MRALYSLSRFACASEAACHSLAPTRGGDAGVPAVDAAGGAAEASVAFTSSGVSFTCRSGSSAVSDNTSGEIATVAGDTGSATAVAVVGADASDGVATGFSIVRNTTAADDIATTTIAERKARRRSLP